VVQTRVWLRRLIDAAAERHTQRRAAAGRTVREADTAEEAQTIVPQDQGSVRRGVPNRPAGA
jgi:hypothetical protein